MGGEPVEFPKDGDWKRYAFAWLASQGVSTVLLFALCYAAYTGIPRWIDSTNEAIERMSTRHDEAVEKLAVEHKEAVKMAWEMRRQSATER